MNLKIIKLIKNLHESDCMPTKVIRREFVTENVNGMFSQSHLNQQIYKNASRSKKETYRLVSILLSLYKIYERYV